MRTSLFASAALVAGLIGLSPAIAIAQEEQPKPEAELKKAKEQLEKLLQELRDQEAKKAKPDAPKPPPPAANAELLDRAIRERILQIREQEEKRVKPDAPKAVAPPVPATPAVPMRPALWTVQPGGDAAAALKSLLSSKDPRTVALAKELLEQLAKTAPKPGSEPRFEVTPPQGLKSRSLELELKPGAAPNPGAQFELKFAPRAEEPKTVEKRIVVAGDKGTTWSTTSTTGSSGGASTLKLSADGKTAAVVAGDGTVTIYDVASGKELMKFPGKK